MQRIIIAIAATLTAAFYTAGSHAQTFEPIDSGIDISNATSVPPAPSVVPAQPGDAQLGPAVTNETADTAPIPQVLTQTQPAQAQSAGTFQSVDSASLTPPIANNNYPNQAPLAVQQLQLQEQQLKRIEKVEQGLNKLVKKQSVSKSLMGTIISAAATADPVMAVVGGVAGYLVGKAKDYKEAEKRNYQMEQDILRKSPYLYTDQELRLAAYAGTELDPALMRPEQLQAYANYVFEAKTRTVPGDWQTSPPAPGATANQDPYQLAALNGQLTVNQVSAQMAIAPEVCAGVAQYAASGKQSEGVQNASMQTSSGRYSISASQRRQLSRFCFYSIR